MVGASAVTERIQNFIGGRWLDAEGAPARTIVNPANGSELGRVASSGADDVDVAVAAATAAFPGWRGATPAERASHLLALADTIDAHAEELAGIELANVGKPRVVALESRAPRVTCCGSARARPGCSMAPPRPSTSMA